MYVFLDESGDLSFDFDKRGVSANFIITILIVENPKPLERAVKKVIRWMKHRYPKHRGCLHAYHELEVSTLSPYEHKCLQAADLLTWSAFRMLERGDSSYIDIVKSSVSVSRLFP